jgi:hypothetical protein
LLVANPSLEVVTKGAEASLDPVFDISARAGWKLSRRLTSVTDYFSAAATTRHLQPQPNAHHLLFTGAGLNLAPGWEFEGERGPLSHAPRRAVADEIGHRLQLLTSR